MSKHRKVERLDQQEAESKHRGVRDDVRALLSKTRVSTWVGPDKRKEDDTTFIYRDNVRDPKTGELVAVPAVSPTERARRAGGFSHEVEMMALLDQLQQLQTSSRTDIEMSSGRRTPSSRAPSGGQYAELLVDMAAGTADLRREALTQLNRDCELVRHVAGKTVQLQPDTASNLRALTELVDLVEDDLAAKIARQIRSWSNAARLLLSVNAPMATLENCCPMCGQQSLIVRADASSDVVCANKQCVDENGRTVRWPRSRWNILLEHLAR